MKDFDTRVYNISDFVEWHDRGQLELSPDFQRRNVWSTKAKSYLIDTIIRGKPIPKLLLTQDLRDRRNVRVVVDGQQRLRSILEFVSDDFRISRAHNRELAGRAYSGLPEETKDEFLKYEVGVDLLYDLPYADILDIFARLNTYTTRLNKQELLNSQYVGYFKQLAFSLGYLYVDYFVEAKILTKATVTRMAEAELSSDLIVAISDGIQSNKSIETYYKKYDDEFPDVDEVGRKFEETMAKITALYPAAEIATTNWSRIHLFYSLFTAVAHGLFGLRGLEDTPRPAFGRNLMGRLRVILDDVSANFDLYSEMLPNTEGVPADFATFIQYSRRGTTDRAARLYRADFVARQLASAG